MIRILNTCARKSSSLPKLTSSAKCLDKFVAKNIRVGTLNIQNVLLYHFKLVSFQKQSAEWPRRFLHTGNVLRARTFHANENDFMYSFVHCDHSAIQFSILPVTSADLDERGISEKPSYDETLPPPPFPPDIETLLARPWRTSNATDILAAFRTVHPHCTQLGVNLSDRRFDNLVDGLMDDVEHLTDAQLFELLAVLASMPMADTYRAHNFHDTWSALDDVCSARLPQWAPPVILQCADLWYRLHMARIGDFVFAALDRMERFAKALDAKQLVHMFFLLNACRRRKVTFEVEAALERHMRSLTVDELGVVALGYFKTEGRIKVHQAIRVMVDAVVASASTVNDVTLAAILKVIRLTANIATVNEIYRLLDCMVPEMDRLSDDCHLHLALLGTSLLVYHPPTLEKVCERFLTNYKNGDKGRLKFSERLLIPLTMFNHYTPLGDEAVRTIFQDLHGEHRRKEMAQYPRCAPSALHFCSLHDLHSPELLDGFLDKEWLDSVYGKNYIIREIFSLDATVEIEGFPYNGNRIQAKLRWRAARQLTDWSPSYIQPKRITENDKTVLSMVDVLVKIAGGDSAKVTMQHVLPQYAKADIILCEEKSTGNFVRPFCFYDAKLGDVLKPVMTEEYRWYAFVILNHNVIIRDTNQPVGQMEAKRRQLQKIGYDVFFIILKDYYSLTDVGREAYLKSLLNKET